MSESQPNKRPQWVKDLQDLGVQPTREQENAVRILKFIREGTVPTSQSRRRRLVTNAQRTWLDKQVLDVGLNMGYVLELMICPEVNIGRAIAEGKASEIFQAHVLYPDEGMKWVPLSTLIPTNQVDLNPPLNSEVQ